MEQKRLYFIDAIRAWAILMMLQGHFIDGLLDPVFRDSAQATYKLWLYFRGITAPVFFTASGLIFTYLIYKNKDQAYRRQRIKKGLVRVAQLLLLGYALRLNMRGLFQGQLYASFFYVDVLHCIGLSLLAIIGLHYWLGKYSQIGLGWIFLGLTGVLFIFEPAYDKLPWEGVPQFLSHYFTKAHGSVFTVIPWMGYSLLGGFLAVQMMYFKEKRFFYPMAIFLCTIVGILLKYQSSALFIAIYERFDLEIFKSVAYNNYLFIRFGDVLWVLAVFMACRSFLKHPYLLKIGQNTLSIYVVHAIILYGSFHGFGLYRFFKKSLDLPQAIGGALIFVTCCVLLSFAYVSLAPWRSQIFSRIFKKNLKL